MCAVTRRARVRGPAIAMRDTLDRGPTDVRTVRPVLRRSKVWIPKFSNPAAPRVALAARPITILRFMSRTSISFIRCTREAGGHPRAAHATIAERSRPVAMMVEGVFAHDSLVRLGDGY